MTKLREYDLNTRSHRHAVVLNTHEIVFSALALWVVVASDAKLKYFYKYFNITWLTFIISLFLDALASIANNPFQRQFTIFCRPDWQDKWLTTDICLVFSYNWPCNFDHWWSGATEWDQCDQCSLTTHGHTEVSRCSDNHCSALLFWHKKLALTLEMSII